MCVLHSQRLFRCVCVCSIIACVRGVFVCSVKLYIRMLYYMVIYENVCKWYTVCVCILHHVCACGQVRNLCQTCMLPLRTSTINTRALLALQIWLRKKKLLESKYTNARPPTRARAEPPWKQAAICLLCSHTTSVEARVPFR